MIRKLARSARLAAAVLAAVFISAPGVQVAFATDLLAPSPKFRAEDNNGNPLTGGKLFTYQAGSTTKTPTYTDSTGGTPNTNPVILDTRGEANVWMVPGQAYKFTLSPSTDSDPPTGPIWTVDNIFGTGTLASILFDHGLTSSVDPCVSSCEATLAQIPNNTVLGNVSGSTNYPVPINTAQLTALCNTFTTALSGCVPAGGSYPSNNVLLTNGTWGPCAQFTSALAGCVPASGGGHTNILFADGWGAAPSFPSIGTCNLLGGNAGAFTCITVGSGLQLVGNVLSATGTGSSGAGFQMFTGSGTFTIPATAIKVRLVGGGGGAVTGTCPNEPISGGEGADAIVWFTGLTVGNTLTVTVGAGGLSVNDGSCTTVTAGNGGASTIASGTQTITTATAGGGAGSVSTGGGGTDGTVSNISLWNGYSLLASYGNGGDRNISGSMDGQPGLVLIEW
jgi:prepilin-type processing-associated H-X9-DG protein